VAFFGLEAFPQALPLECGPGVGGRIGRRLPVLQAVLRIGLPAPHRVQLGLQLQLHAGIPQHMAMAMSGPLEAGQAGAAADRQQREHGEVPRRVAVGCGRCRHGPPGPAQQHADRKHRRADHHADWALAQRGGRVDDTVHGPIVRSHFTPAAHGMRLKF